jgi:hypothetical protein
MKEELLALVEEYYAGKVQELNAIIKEMLEKELTPFPPITPCASLDLTLSTPSKQSCT